MRRRKIAHLSSLAVLDLLNFGTGSIHETHIEIPAVSGLPDGTVVQGVSYDFARGTISIIVAHESFPEVPEGEKCGEIDEPLSFSSINVERLEAGTRVWNERLKIRVRELEGLNACLGDLLIKAQAMLGDE